MNALVVARDDALRERLADFFRGRGHDVTSTGDADDALAALGGGTFQYVLVDLDLGAGPGDGAGALDVCRAAHGDDDRHVVVLTGEETPERLRAAFEAGADDYLVKPVATGALKLRLALGDRALAARRARRQGERREALGEKRYRTLVEVMAEGLFEVDDGGVIRFANSSLSRITGYSANELLGRSADELLVDPEIRDRLPGRTLLGGGVGSEQYTLPLRGKDGRKLWVALSAAPVPDVGHGTTALGVLQDVTDQRKAEEALDRERIFFLQLFQNSPMAIVVLDPDDRIVECNRSFTDLFQFEQAEIVGRELSDFIVPEELRDQARALSQAVTERQTVETETVRRRKDGSLVDVAVLGYPVELASERIGAFGLYVDISERKAAERKLFHDAFHDALTGLPNRVLLVERLERALRRAERHRDYLFALAFLDLDGFKAVNDSLGHGAGDELLVEVARRLDAEVRPGDTVARLGGDEFTLLLDDLDHPADASSVAERVLARLEEPIRLGDEEVRISGSIGVAFSYTGYATVDDLMQDADVAMYRAKTRGKACFEIFDADMQESVRARRELETELRRAIAEEAIWLEHQPIVSLGSGRPVAWEAVLRWEHPQHGSIAAAEIRRVAQQTGLVRPLARWMLLTVCRRAAEHADRLRELGARLAVDVGLEDLRHGDFLGDLDAALTVCDGDPALVALEVPEAVTSDPIAAPGGLLDALRDRDVALVLDGFGHGTTALGTLSRLAVHRLKVRVPKDADLTAGDSPTVHLLRATVALGEALGIAVAADGVETAAQEESLRTLGVGAAQGPRYVEGLGD